MLSERAAKVIRIWRCEGRIWRNIHNQLHHPSLIERTLDLIVVYTTEKGRMAEHDKFVGTVVGARAGASVEALSSLKGSPAFPSQVRSPR